MNRNTRTLIVLVVAVLTAGVASFGVYAAIRRMPVKEVEVAHTFVVAAARSLPMGTRVTAADVRLVAWPEGAPVAGSFTKVESVLERGVISGLQENEPLTETKLAPTEAGAGLSPAIPEGMRAISVRVNEVIGVAGFVTPGTRVDVFATIQQAPDSFTRIVVSNVQVLTAGTRYDQDKTKEGEAMPSSVVTLLLTPEDAERVVLASSDGQLMLALRNPLDIAMSSTSGTRMATLFGEAPKPIVAPPPPPAPRRKPAAPPAIAVPDVPKPPPAYIVETIRGAKRGEETIR